MGKPSAEEVVKLPEASYNAGGNVKCWKTVWKVFVCLFKLNIYFSYDPAILLIGVYPSEMKTHVHTQNMYIYVHGSFIHNVNQKRKQP